MDRELLLEIGCEEIPAAWLPPLVSQLGEQVAHHLRAQRLTTDGPVEVYSTPRRLAARVAKVSERQSDLEETVTGPAVSAAFGPGGAPTPAALGFARKHGVEVDALERVETARGLYLAVQKRQRGRAAVDVLPDVLGGVLRGLSFPRQMRWDALLEDGRGELLFGRPIRWLLFLYGGRVVPFTIRRSPEARSPLVQDVQTGAVTYGHRFLALAGRPGRSIKVRSFKDYAGRLAEHFVILDRTERQDRIRRELDAKARRLDGRLYAGAARSELLDEVPDLVEYPTVVAGTFAPEFLELPGEVLSTTMIHHQHFFPVVDAGDRLKPAFLAVTNTQPENERAVALNAERVLAARLRDAVFFWQSDRRHSLESRLDRLDTILFHKTLGSYRAKAQRIEELAGWIAGEVFGRPEAAAHAALAARLAKVDLVTDMVRELTELQGTMGGIYAREEGQPEAVWKAIYYQYLPTALEADAPPARRELGEAAICWAAVSLADKLDTLVGMFRAGERPTGSRDPYGLRRAAQGIVRILVDLPELTGLDAAPTLGRLTARTDAAFAGGTERDPDLAAAGHAFLVERVQHLFELRGFRRDEVLAVSHIDGFRSVGPLDARRRLEAIRRVRASSDFEGLAVLFKRVKNIARELPIEAFPRAEREGPALDTVLVEPAERELLAELERRGRTVAAAASAGDYETAFLEAAGFRPAVDRFFTDVFVMVDDAGLRTARLRLVRQLEELILGLADISEMAVDEAAGSGL